MIQMLVFIAFTSLLMGGCQPKVIKPGPIEAPPAGVINIPPYKSTLTAKVAGNVKIAGEVFRANDTNCCYTDTKTGSFGEKLKIADSRVGSENEKCGGQEYWRQSNARSVAEFTPQIDETTRTYGFSLTTDSFGRGGRWKDYSLGMFCNGSHDVWGIGESKSEGRIEMTFNAENASISDRLIIRVSGSGAPSAYIALKDVNNHKIPLKALAEGRGLVADLPKPGPYLLEAKINNKEANRGGDSESGSNKVVNVTVQSMRDALELGYGDPVAPDFSIPVQVYFPIKDLESELKKSVFTNEGRFFPCEKEDECDPVAQEIYLEWPELTIDGAWVVLKTHLSGHASWGWFRPGITGDIMVHAVPNVEKIDKDDFLLLEKVQIETKTRNQILEYISSKYADTLENKVEDKAKINLTPYYKKAIDKISSQFPINWGPGYLDLVLDDIRLSDITTNSDRIVVILKLKIKYHNKKSPITETTLKTDYPIKEIQP